MMKFAVVSFPGSNCDEDLYHAIKDDLHESATIVPIPQPIWPVLMLS